VTTIEKKNERSILLLELFSETTKSNL